MPIYEYRCENCETVIEKRQKFSDPPLTTCEVCGGPLQRLISAPGLQFKGTGWYVTDYARGGNGKPGASAQSKSGGKASASKPEKTGATPKKD